MSHTDSENNDRNGGQDDTAELQPRDAFTEENHRQQNADQWVDEVAECGLRHLPIVDQVDVHTPVDGDQQCSNKNSAPGLGARGLQLWPCAHEAEGNDHKDKRPDESMRQNLHGPRRLQQRKVERKQRPQKVRTECLNHC